MRFATLGSNKLIKSSSLILIIFLIFTINYSKLCHSSFTSGYYHQTITLPAAPLPPELPYPALRPPLRATPGELPPLTGIPPLPPFPPVPPQPYELLS